MTKLSDFLNENSARTIARTHIKIGDVFLIPMDRRNGITPKDGDTYRNKYFIVLGFDNRGCVYGGVIINSGINQRVFQSIQDWHMPIKKAKYTFLEHDSYVDCSRLKYVDIQKFSIWNFKGVIEHDDIALIIGAIKESPNEKRENLSRFGIQ